VIRQGTSDDEEEGPPGAVQEADNFSPPQSNQQVTVTVSPGLKSPRYNSNEAVFFQFSATVPCSLLLLVLEHSSMALPSVLLM
jgi:hypothetical protein